MKSGAKINQRKELSVQRLDSDKLAAYQLTEQNRTTGVYSWDYSSFYQPYDLHELSLNEETRSGIWVKLFNQCNNRCIFCPDPQTDIGMIDMDLALETFTLLYNRGVRRITLSGGEPTLSPYIFDLIKALKKIGFSSICLASNGRRLAREDFCQKLLAAGVSDFYISLQGWDSSSGNYLNGREQSFEQTVAGLHVVSRLKTPTNHLALNHIVTTLSMEHLNQVVDLAIAVEASSLQLSMLEQYVAGPDNENLIASLDQLRLQLPALLQRLERHNIEPVLEGIPPCHFIGYEHYYLDYRRDRSQNLRFIYQPEKTRDQLLINRGTMRHVVHRQGKKCEGCDYNRACSGLYFSYLKKFGETELHPVNVDTVRGADAAR